MIITSHKTSSLNIKIIKILSGLTGNWAVKFRKSIYDYQDEGKCCYLIDLKHVKNIDGLGLQALEYFINRAVNVRLFNVNGDIRLMINLSGKEAVFKIYNESDPDRAVSMFEREIVGEKAITDDVKMRRHLRIDTFFKVDFKYHPGYNGVISARTTVLNISEAGMFADQILAINAKTGEIVVPQSIEGHELYDMEFRLNENSDVIETGGKCVREIKTHEKLCAGISFKDMKEIYKDRIRDFVEQAKTSESIMLEL